MPHAMWRLHGARSFRIVRRAMPGKHQPLGEYFAKRDFDKTAEPAPEVESERKGPLLFVVQKHNATRLHYDFRLELDGVLKSWAVPKGFSYHPEDKHMAVMVEDHPFDYASFEGLIPKGEYGGGEVIVWDTGTYWCDENDKHPCPDRAQAETEIRDQLAGGKLSIFLRGSKLKGSWALVQMKQGQDWLLIKHRDRYADWKENVLGEEDSVLSGLSIADLERGTLPDQKYDATELIPHGRVEAYPPKLKPMLASIADGAFDDPDWVFEPKLDGIRVLAFIKGSKVRLESRNGLDLSSQFPAICRQLQEQYTRGMVIDAEIVAFDGATHSFNAMLKRLHLKDAGMIAQMDAAIPCVMYAFDLLHFEAIDLRGKQLKERRRLLQQALLPTDLVHLISQVPEEGEMLFEAIQKAGFEGIIAKKANSHYEQGRRSKNWLKVKSTQSAEFVVGGFTIGEGSRTDTFGSLLTGYYKEGDLVYAGNVGSGFDDHQLPEIRELLNRITADGMPFSEKPPLLGPVVWTKPEMVIEAKYNQITPAGIMRGPVFLRVRDDVSPKSVGSPPVPIHVKEADPPDPPTEAAKDVIEAVLNQLDNNEANLQIDLDGSVVPVTNLNKELWPANTAFDLTPFTKRDLLIYLTKVSPHMIRHLQDRPLTMIRFPEGIHGEKFFQKHWEQRRPDFVESVTLYSESNDTNQTYLLVNNLPTLLWLGQLGTLEFHVWGSRCVDGDDARDLSTNFTDSSENIDRSVLNYPDMIKFDLDPYVYSGKEKEGEEPELHREGFEKGKTVAFWLKQLLDSLGLNSFVKTTGKTGLHIFVPIARNLDYDAVRSISEALCRSLELQHPKEITTEWNTKKRTGKIFMDYNMNVRAKTLNSAYSPRALPNQAVAMPVTWEELPDVYPTDFNMRNAPVRLAKKGDVWSKIDEMKKDISALVG